jgi:hypothetical protein
MTQEKPRFNESSVDTEAVTEYLREKAPAAWEIIMEAGTPFEEEDGVLVKGYLIGGGFDSYPPRLHYYAVLRSIEADLDKIGQLMVDMAEKLGDDKSSFKAELVGRHKDAATLPEMPPDSIVYDIFPD